MILRKGSSPIIIICILFFLFSLPGCQPAGEPDAGVEDDFVEQETGKLAEEESAGEMDETGPSEDSAGDVSSGADTGSPVDYYWPWLSHGNLLLSSGEAILGPDLFESDLGFIAEFPAGTEYSGRVIWLVEGSDVFALEWVDLSFDVEYYEQNEWSFMVTFDFMIDNLQAGQDAEGLKELPLDLYDQQDGFAVRIDKIVLGKNQEGDFSGESIDYIALDITMVAKDNQ
ncbi:MAG TPA: hypothetical protein ENN91_02895 [Firmicutes bacterium]|nr:hypothetical protein [Bacillota bacterium]